MSDFSADYLLQKKDVWHDLIAKAKKIEKNIHWSKIVIHEVPVQSFLTQKELNILKNEIEIFNSQLKLMKNSAWLCSQENLQFKLHASIIIAVENAKQAEFALQNRLCIAGLWLETQKAENSAGKSQCTNCQKWEHIARFCKYQTCC